MIPRGAVLAIEGVSETVLVTRDGDGQVHRLQVGPAGGTHVNHAAPAVGGLQVDDQLEACRLLE